MANIAANRLVLRLVEQTAPLTKMGKLIIPQIAPWEIDITYWEDDTYHTRFEISHPEKPDVFIIVITFLIPPEQSLFEFHNVTHMIKPWIVEDYQEVLHMKYVHDAQHLLRWILSHAGMTMERFIDIFRKDVRADMPLHGRLGMPEFKSGTPYGPPSWVVSPWYTPPQWPVALPPARPAIQFTAINAGQGQPTAPDTARHGKLQAQVKTKRRKAVPLADWDGFKAWKQAKGGRVTASAKHREVSRDDLDAFQRYQLEQQGHEVPDYAKPSYGYDLTRDGDYVQKGPDWVVQAFEEAEEAEAAE